MSMAIAEILTGVVFLIIAAGFFIQAMYLPPAMNPADAGPAAFPILITITMAILSVFLLVKGIRDKNKESQIFITIKRGKSVLWVVVSLVAYVIVMPLAGYFISTVVMFPVLLYFAGEKNWKRLALLSISFVVFAKVVFQMILRVPLP